MLPLTGLAIAKPVSLPHSAPVPEQSNRQDEKSVTQPSDEADTLPVPQPRPDDNNAKPIAPADAPLPSQKPEAGADDDAAPTKPTKPLADPRSATTAAKTMPEEELACRKRLNALGVAFEDRAPRRPSMMPKQAGRCHIPFRGNHLARPSISHRRP